MKKKLLDTITEVSNETPSVINNKGLGLSAINNNNNNNDEVVVSNKSNRENRLKRRAGYSNRKLMTVENLPEGLVGRWVNDEANRIHVFQQKGWDFITDKNITVGEKQIEPNKSVGAVIHRRVGIAKDNTPLLAYLMVIDRDLYEEDQAKKQRAIDATEAAILRKETTSAGITTGAEMTTSFVDQTQT